MTKDTKHWGARGIAGGLSYVICPDYCDSSFLELCPLAQQHVEFLAYDVSLYGWVSGSCASLRRLT